jgi:hypothetical protein
MCPIKIEELRFDHLVIFEKDNTLFAAARYNGSNSLRIFLVYESTGNVYTRNGRADSWEEISGIDAEGVRNRIAEARANNIPTYHINGTHNN